MAAVCEKYKWDAVGLMGVTGVTCVTWVTKDVFRPIVFFVAILNKSLFAIEIGKVAPLQTV